MFLLFLAIGGMLGTLARYLVGGWVVGWVGIGLPWGTLAVNLSGSFLLGVAVRVAELTPVPPEMRALVMVGFCGAFTTFSTYTLETIALIQEGAWIRAGAYALGSLVLGLAAMILGLQAANVLLRGGG